MKNEGIKELTDKELHKLIRQKLEEAAFFIPIKE